jgi:hypothetical protein
MMKIVMVLATLANVVALRGIVPRVSRYVAPLSCNEVFVSYTASRSRFGNDCRTNCDLSSSINAVKGVDTV